MLRILLGLVISVIGFFLTWKSEWFYQNFGTFEWAEINLSGGSRMLYKLAGIGIILIGFAIISNLMENILTWFAGLFIK